MSNPLENALKVIIEQAQPDKVILFGSRARNEDNSDSDYDILILKKGVFRSNEILKKIYKNLGYLGVPMDFIISEYEVFERNVTNPYMIYSEAAKYGRILYEK
jgi:uncharacterized protein